MHEFVHSMKVKILDIEAGKMISILNQKNANEFGLMALDRIKISKKNGIELHTPVDVTDSFVKPGEIGLFEDVARYLKVTNNSIVTVTPAEKPESVKAIRKKINNQKLNQQELLEIVKDINSNHLSEIETAAFLTAVQINGFDLDETVFMTNALIETGNKIDFGQKIILDKHSVGGTNGRATMIVVPIIAAAGYMIPKTSSRSITSACGTADAMEVLAPVSLSLKQLKDITQKTGGVIAWGGAINLAPADDKIIKIEHPLSLDPKGQVIASVMAKKASVGSKFLVIDLPVGPDTKIKNKIDAEEIAFKFLEVGKKVGIKVEVVITDGTKPSGNAFGAALEARLAMEILEGKKFDDLAKKSCELAGALLELVGDCKQGQGYTKAKHLLESGKALKKMHEIIIAQGGKIVSSKKISEPKFKQIVYSQSAGTIKKINVKNCMEIARTAGAPTDKEAGLVLFVEQGNKIKKKSPIFELQANNKRKLELALNLLKGLPIIELEKNVIGKYYFKNN